MYPIPYFAGYFINKYGNVWSEKAGGFLRPGPHSGGYLRVNLYINRKRFARKIHRLVLETFIGPCPDGMECCHNNGNPKDNRLENLRWDTKSNNNLDAAKHGTGYRGEKNGRAKLNKWQIRIIRHLLKSREFLQKEIGEMFGVGRTTIGHIKTEKRWGMV